MFDLLHLSPGRGRGRGEGIRVPRTRFASAHELLELRPGANSEAVERVNTPGNGTRIFFLTALTIID